MYESDYENHLQMPSVRLHSKMRVDLAKISLSIDTWNSFLCYLHIFSMKNYFSRKIQMKILRKNENPSWLFALIFIYLKRKHFSVDLLLANENKAFECAEKISSIFIGYSFLQRSMITFSWVWLRGKKLKIK